MQGKAPENLKIKVGDPITKLGWKKHKIEDLPGGRIVFDTKDSPAGSKEREKEEAEEAEEKEEEDEGDDSGEESSSP